MGTARRRGARSLIDDAVDIVRADPVAVLLLHVLPSLPFFAAALIWCVDLDLRGAMPRGDAIGVVLLLVPKLLGWGALAAWGARTARGREARIGDAWRAVLRRAPETLLAAAATLLLVLATPLTAGLSLVAAFAACSALAAAAGTTEAGGIALVRDAFRACFADLGRAIGMAFVLTVAWGFLVVNLLALPFLLVQLGAGGLGVDLNLWIAALRPDRAAAWGFAGLFALLLVEAVAVLACAAWQSDRESEREGVRFARLADELDERAAARAAGDAAGAPGERPGERTGERPGERTGERTGERAA